MSEHEKVVNDFIHLLKTKPSLFSQVDRDELSQLIDDTTDDIESISNAICDWLVEHPDVDAELEEEQTKLQRGLVITKKRKILDYQPNKEVLTNAIHESVQTSKDNNTDKKS